MISVSVPGKIHLLGEHSVVYGKPALLSAINLRLKLNLSKSEKFKAILNGEDYTKLLNPLKKTLEKKIQKKILKKIPTHQIIIDSQIPIGYGLGSSAAISIAFTVALLRLLKISLNDKLIYEIAIEGEKIFHGNPSGADVAAVINGGYLWFRKETPNFKTYSALSFPKAQKLNNFYLIDSGKPKESTKKMVEMVSLKLKVQSSKLRRIFEEQEELTRELVITFEEGNFEMLIRIIKQGQANLEKLGVVGDKAKNIIRKIEKIGGVGKILGGGGVKSGSGMLLIYCKEKTKLQELSEKMGWSIISISLGEEGLKIDE